MAFSLSGRPAWALSSLRTWGYGGVLGLLLLAGVAPASAQVPLQLLHQVDNAGQNTFEGRPLPPQTTVILLRYPAERPHTLEHAGIPRKELARLVLTRLRSRDTTVRLNEEGKTPQQYASTAQSERIVYALARTPDSTLYESYVNTGDGFVPGFDAVQSGRMTMGPVASREARRRFRAVFRLHREETAMSDPASGTDPPDTSGPPTGPRTGARNAASTRATASRDAPPKSTSQAGDEEGVNPVWMFLLGGLVGGLIGGGTVWLMLSDRLRHAEEEQTKLRRQLRERKNQEFREATGTTLSTSSESEEETRTDSASTDEVERLREENETLERQIDEIKQHLQNLRDSGD